MSAVAVRAMFRNHPEKPAHSDAMSRCIDACFSCVETCTACADACLSERDVTHLVACIRLNLDCAAVCNATGNIMSRANKAGTPPIARSAARQLHRVLPGLRRPVQLAWRAAPALRGLRRGVPCLRGRLQRDARDDADAGLNRLSVAPGSEFLAHP